MRDFERDIWTICTESRTIPWLRQDLAEKTPNDKLKKEALNLASEELLKPIREPWAEFIDSVLDALASDISYEHTYTKIERLGKELEEIGIGEIEARLLRGFWQSMLPEVPMEHGEVVADHL